MKKFEREARSFFAEITPYNKVTPSGKEWPVAKSHTLQAFIAGAELVENRNILLVDNLKNVLVKYRFKMFPDLKFFKFHDNGQTWRGIRYSLKYKELEDVHVFPEVLELDEE